MPKVSVVIVCMNRPDLLYPCLEGIRAHTSVPYEVWVVAYMFSEENLTRLKVDWPDIKVVESRELRGFSENNNLALRQIDSDYCFIVNDDTLMSMPVIDRLVDDFGRLPADAAVVSPKIVFPDGRVQTNGRAPWTAWRYVKHYLHRVDETVPTPWSMKDGLFRTWTVNGACFPTRVRGALQFYSGGKPVKYFLLGSFVWCVEALRRLKYLFADRSDPSSHASIMYATARNVMRSVFTKRTSKDIFIQLYSEIKR